jgi:hypothetical protein
MYLQKVISRKTSKKIVFCWRLEGQLVRASADPDPDQQQNVMDPEHWLLQE